jgi:PEP-CTERM motif
MFALAVGHRNQGAFMPAFLRGFLATGAALAIIWLSALTAEASVVTINFTGTITAINDPSGFISGSNVGDSFSGSLVYDTSAPIAVPGANPAEYDYLPGSTPPYASPLGISITVGSHTFDPHYPGVMQIHVQNDLTGSTYPDAFVAVASTQVGTSASLAVFGLADTTGTALSSTDLPTSLDFSKFDASEFQLTSPTGGPDIFDGIINGVGAPVPEPASVTLLGIGALAMGAFVLRRRGYFLS